MNPRIFIASLLLFFSAQVHCQSDVECMAYTLHREASEESLRSKRAVLDTIHNRMRIRHKTACEVVKEKHQFSWYRRGMRIEPTDKMLTSYWEVASMPKVLPHNAEFFHNKGVSPAWARKLKRVAVIGSHVYYAEVKRRNNVKV